MELFVETIPRWIYVFLSSYFIPQYDYLCALWTMYATQRKVINNEKYPPAQSSSNCERRIKIRNVFWCDPDMQPFLKALGNCSLSIDKLNKQSSVVDFISMYFFAGALSLSLYRQEASSSTMQRVSNATSIEVQKKTHIFIDG